MDTLWESTLGTLRGRLADETFSTWLEPIRFDGIDGHLVRLRIPNRFFADWISARYLPDILESLTTLTGESELGVEWVVDPELQTSAGQVSAGMSTSTARTPTGVRSRAAGTDATRRTRADERIVATEGSIGTATEHEVDPEPPRHLRNLAELGPADALQLATRNADTNGQHRSWQTTELRVGRPASSNRVAARPVSRPSRAHRASGELPLEVERAPRAVGVPSPVPGGPEPDSGYALNPRYQFDNFVVGPSNQLAHAASVAASLSPGTRYNPLFIYSKVGLGKTHLINAVGHRVREDQPDARILFLSAERFTNEFIWALQHKRIDEFRARYRSHCDALIIDDIQFLAGREQTQEEFFHTFNALYHGDKQIVVTSDVYPQHIPEMQERLVSRFQWGLVADIQPPELDTRIAILKKKAEQEQIALRDDVALLVAQLVQSNVRELEGTLLRLVVLAEAQQKPLDIELARTALGAQLPKDRPIRETSVEDVQRAACEYFQIGLKELLGDRRHRNVALPRMIAMFVCRERLELSYPMIGARFGNKDHTTVMNAHRKISALRESDDRVRRAIEAIETRCGIPS